MITFNGISVTSFDDFVSVMQVNRPGSASNRGQLLSIVGRDGVYYFGKDGEPQTISFRLALKSATAADRRKTIRQIAAWLETEDPKVLTFDDEDDIIYYAVLVDAINADEFINVGFLDVNLLIPDGCAYSLSALEVEFTAEEQNLFLGEPTGGNFKLGQEDYNFTWNQYDGQTWEDVI